MLTSHPSILPIRFCLILDLCIIVLEEKADVEWTAECVETVADQHQSAFVANWGSLVCPEDGVVRGPGFTQDQIRWHFEGLARHGKK